MQLNGAHSYFRKGMSTVVMETVDELSTISNLSVNNHRYQGYDGLISVERALDNYAIPSVCALGMLGNLVNLLVLTRGGYNQIEAAGERAVQSGLVALSISDFLFCLIMFPRAFVGSTLSLFPSPGFRLFYQRHGSWAVTSLIMTSTWITVTLATLRYLGICHPLRCRRLVGVVPERIAYLVVTLICWGVNLPAFWQYHISEMPMSHNRTFYLVDIGALDFSTPPGIAFQWIKGLVGVLVPAIILIYCNTALVRALRRSQKVRQHVHVNNRAARSRYRVTVTLAAISVAFVVLVLPSEVMDFLFRVVEANEARTEVFLLARALANSLQVLNFAGNFVLYCSVNSRFRKSLIKLFRGQRRDSQSSSPPVRRQSYFRFQITGSTSRSAGSGNTLYFAGNRSNRNGLGMTTLSQINQWNMIGSMNLVEYKPPGPVIDNDSVLPSTTERSDTKLTTEVNIDKIEIHLF